MSFGHAASVQEKYPPTLKQIFYLKFSYRCDPEVVENETYYPEFLFGMSNYLGTGGEYAGQWNADMYLQGLDPYISDGEWHDYIIDLTDNAFWEADPEYGDLSEIRIDIFNDASAVDNYIDFKYVAFLKSEEDANNFGIDEFGNFGLAE